MAMDGNVLFYWVIVPAIKIAIAAAVVPLTVAFLTWCERKIIAFIQVRLGPMRTGFLPHGLLQPIADVLKLFLKEDIVPSRANRLLFLLAPALTFIPAFLAISVLPFGPEVEGWASSPLLAPLAAVARAVGADLDRPLAMAITDLNIGLLFIVAISSLGVFGLLIAGWASNSKYPLLGGLRSAAQMISYEVPLGFALVAGMMMAGTMSMQGIIDAQRELGWSLFLLQPISLFLYFVSGVAETNRVPFDLPEAENELVAGFHTEYSGMKFAFFFLAEYINIITVAAIAVTVFLGGWLPIGHGLWSWLGWDRGWLAWLYSPLLGFLFFLVKIALVYYVYFWLRATLPRYRYDQLMALGWKWLIPLALGNIFLVGINVVLRRSLGAGPWLLLVLAAVDLLLVLVVVHLARSLRGTDVEASKQALGTAH
jgi:NADH-quinone oxidoreductase subunit H